MRIALLTAAAFALLVAGCSPTDGPAPDESTSDATAVAANETDSDTAAEADLAADEADDGADDADGAAGEAEGEGAVDGDASGADADESDSDTVEGNAEGDDESGPEPTPDPTLQAFYSNFQPPMMGDPEAQVTILEFSDYLCPYCGVYAGDTSHEIEDEYVDDGLVSMVFIDFPIPGHGYPAVISHEAAHCASEQDSYWEMHYALFEEQEQLIELDPRDEQAAVPVVVGIAEGIGLDGDAIEACIDSQIYRPIIGNLLEQAQARGINVTPTLLIMSAAPDGEVRNEAVTGYLPMDEFRPYIERALSHSQGTPVPDPEPQGDD